MIADATLRAVARAGTPPWDVSDRAPSTLADVFGHFRACGRILVYAGASERTVFGDPSVNHAFRAWHDWCHIRTGLGFDVPSEVALARWQQSECSDALARVVWVEVAEQAIHFERTGQFVVDQVAFAAERGIR